MNAAVNTARAVRKLANIAALLALALALVFANSAPDWCDAPQRDAAELCAVTR